MKNSLAFTLPVVLENMVTTGASLVFSSITGGIGKSSLAAAGVGNQALSLMSSIFCMLTTGSAILASRETGKGDALEANRIAEHTLLLAPLLSLALMGILLCASDLAVRLLLPGAEEELLREGRLYYNVLLLSLPGLVTGNACSGLLRAAGDSNTAFRAAFLSCLFQVLCAWVFTGPFKMGILGVALAIVICRYVSMLYLLYVLFKSGRGFNVRLEGILKPDRAHIARIFRVGIPASLDSLAVQIGYVSISSMMVSLGRGIPESFNVINTVLLFTGICQTIGTNISTTLVGHLAGAGDMRGARVMSMKILFICEAVSMVLCIPTVACPGVLAGFFTKNEEIYEMSRDFMWILFPHTFAAVGCNVCEPSARVGGAVKFTMAEIILCVLLIRLPLTWLFCLKLDWGLRGMFLANMISLYVRMASAVVRILTRGWGKEKRTI